MLLIWVSTHPIVINLFSVYICFKERVVVAYVCNIQILIYDNLQITLNNKKKKINQ